MSEINIQKLKFEIDKLINELEIDINNDPCMKFMVLTRYYKIINSYVDDSEISRFMANIPRKDFKLMKTKQTRFLVYMINYICNNNDKKFSEKLKLETILKIMHITTIIYYKSYLNKNLKYCDEAYMNYTISNMRSQFTIKKYGVFGGIKKLNFTVFNNLIPKYFKSRCTDKIVLVNVPYYLRTSVAQTLRSLIGKYIDLKNGKVQPKIKDTSRYEALTEIVYNNIMLYGNIKKAKSCNDDTYEKILNITSLNVELVRKSIYEVIYTMDNVEQVSYQKVIANLKKLHYSAEVLKQLKIEVTNQNLACLVNIYLEIIKE